MLHVRRCGWLSAQQLGALLLEQARERGVQVLRAEVVAVETEGGRVAEVVVRGEEGEARLRTPVFVNAAGPGLERVGQMTGADLPVYCESHVKLSFDDDAAAVDRTAPLIIWSDPTRLPWSSDEREALGGDPEAGHLLDTFPAGVHGRPDGAGRTVLLYWPYHCEPCEPRFPIDWDPAYPEVVMRGMSVMVPGLAAYYERIPNLYVDGGYYTKTEENRPLIGPVGVPGAFVTGAFSGFGIMTALGAGELLADHVVGGALPDHAPAFRLERYDDPAYQALLADWPESGQL